MIRIQLDSAWRVRTYYTASLPVDCRAAWQVLKDFERIVCLDHFHRRVGLMAEKPAPGAAFDLPHEALGLRVARRGRILRWDEGRGYSFSDLSAKNPLRGFPHVFTIELSNPAEVPDTNSSQLKLSVHGRWTARFVPRPLIYLWLVWNVMSLGLAIENAVLATPNSRDLTFAE